MPPVRRLVRSSKGWLVIPASLLMVVAGCQTDQVSSDQSSPDASHLHAQALDGESPFRKVFNGNADFVVLTFFDLYCVACQQSANNFNVLNDRLAESFPDAAIQMSGIGIGDTAFELTVFQRKYQLGYACLPDPEKTFEEPFAVRGTPTILVFQRKGMDCLEIYRHEGRFRMDDLNQLVADLSQRITTN